MGAITAAMAFVGILGMAAANAPAKAHDFEDGDGWHRHEWREHEWRQHARENYLPPSVVYLPPGCYVVRPTYYTALPAYYALPSLYSVPGVTIGVGFR